jgi:hypothetical protein
MLGHRVNDSLFFEKVYHQNLKSLPCILNSCTDILKRQQIYIALCVMQEMPYISVNLAVLLLDADQRSLFKADISAQQRKEMCFFLLSVLLQRISKLQNCLTQLMKLCSGFFQSELLLFKPEYKSMLLFQQKR